MYKPGPIKIYRRVLFLVLIYLTSACERHQQIEKQILIKHMVMADGHPMTLWEKSSPTASEAILLVHGRTWSAVPDFDLQVEGEDLSLMDGLVEAGYAVYAIDMRGYGETPRDETEWLTPDRAAKDLAIVAQWIAEQKEWRIKPHLFGWSMGSTNAQLMAQRHPKLISSLILFGYWFDNDGVIPPDTDEYTPQKIVNTAESAASDFIVPGSISQKAINAYVALSLKSDPLKVDWKNLDQYNELDPDKVIIPTLVLQGEHDPIAPTDRQAKLYTRLGTAHKQWITIPGGDHAAFMETPRAYFIHSLVSFLKSVSPK
jgi:alpha-beta hydrolase superfamily lysophospholipase